MKKLLIVALFVNAVLLAGRFWQEANADLGVGGGEGVRPCEADPTLYSLDTNASGKVDIADFIHAIQWFFKGTEAPKVCLATNDVGGRLAALEALTIENESRTAALEASILENESRTAALEARVDVAVEDVVAVETLSARDSERIVTNSFEINNLFDAVVGVLCRAGLPLLGLQGDEAGGGGGDPRTDNDDTVLEAKTPLQAMLCALEPDIVPDDEFRFLGYNSDGYREYEHRATAEALDGPGSGLIFVLLNGTSSGYWMGSSLADPNRGSDEVQHRVKLSPFLIAKYEVTQDQYAKLMVGGGSAGVDPEPSTWAVGPQLPVTNVTWNDLYQQGDTLAESGFLVKWGLSLPTEAQWEYAARSGTSTAFWIGPDFAYNPKHSSGTCDIYNELAVHNTANAIMTWCGLTSHCEKFLVLTNENLLSKSFFSKECRPTDVARTAPNLYGIVGMNGNVQEWCEDAYRSDFYNDPQAQNFNPLSTHSGEFVLTRVRRGGSFISSYKGCRASDRGFCEPHACGQDCLGIFCVELTGFRPAKTLGPIRATSSP